MRTALRTIRAWHGPLALFALLMLALAAVCAVAWTVDDRLLLGQPIWAKPLKFSLSFTAYAVTLAWLLSQRPARRAGWWAGTVVAVASTTEMAAIVGQAARGHRSHFNVSTPLDAAVFSGMGALVAVIFLGTLTVAVLVLRGRTQDRALTLALRCGTWIALAGMSVGFLMLRATPEQLREQAAGAPATYVGAHAVGVPDGGPGLWLLGWSTTGGDLRVGHFLGMHALQALPLVALVLAGLRLEEATRVRVIGLTALLYGGTAALAVWQALRGQAVTSPDAATLLALGALVLVTGGAAAATLARTGAQGPAAPSGAR